MTESPRFPALALIVLLAALLACHEERAELPYARLGVVASELALASAPSESRSVCVLFPVLRGSRVETSIDLDGTLSVDVATTREGATVTFANASPAVPSKELSRDEIQQEFSEQLEVKSATGARYVVVLSSECEPDAATY